MKKLKLIALLLGILFIAAACNSGPKNSKADSWSEQQEQTWKENCLKLLKENGTSEGPAKEFCDCMFEKTSEMYTPEEAAGLTTKQEQEIWDKCDYNW